MRAFSLGGVVHGPDGMDDAFGGEVVGVCDFGGAGFAAVELAAFF